MCQGRRGRGESSPTQSDGIHKGIHKHTSDKTTWLISKWKQCINSALNKLDKDNIERHVGYMVVNQNVENTKCKQ